MTPAQFNLLQQAQMLLQALDRSGARVMYSGTVELRAAIVAVEVEAAADLPRIDVPALLRRQAE